MQGPKCKTKENIPLCLKYINKNYIYIYIYMYSIEHDIFIASVTTSFGRYGHHQANVVQNLKRLATFSA
jgi:hypothetical protein